MVSQILKLISRIGQVVRICGTLPGIRYGFLIARHLPEVVRRGDLQPADRAMRGTFSIRFRGQCLTVPCSDVDAVNTIAGDGPTFAGIREIFSDEVYLRGFTDLGNIDTFVDLGANRGMVSLLAAAGLGARKVVGVEPQAPYGPCFEILAKANGLSPDQCHREVKFAGAHDDETTISVDGIRKIYGIDRIDFLKCDIEGAENVVVLDDGAFLPHVRLVAMELHPEADTRTDQIRSRMHEAGFYVSLTDADGVPALTDVASYLFASRQREDLALPSDGPD